MDKKRKEQLKKYREKNKDKIKLKKQEYYQNNRRSILKKVKTYRDKPEVKTYRKKYHKKYYQKHKEYLLKKNKKYRDKPENKEKIKTHDKKRQQTPERQKRDKERNKKPKRKAYNKKYRRKYGRQRRQVDNYFRLMCNLRTHFYKAMSLYSKTGKIMKSRKYSINYKAIIKHLGDKPVDGNIYEADHIIPLSLFNHNDPEQIKKAWAPSNFQWLTKEINMWKGNRLIKPLTNEEKIKLQAKLTKNN